MKKLGKYIYITAIITSFIIVVSQMINVVNGVKAVVEELSNSSNVSEQDNSSYNKIPISVSDIVKGLGTAIDYSVFANTFRQQCHMEGNIAVKNAYIGQIFNFTNAVLEIYKTKDYSITVTNKVDGNLTDGTFKFGLFTKQTNSGTGESYYVKTNHDIITVTTVNGEGTATFTDLDSDTKYYIFELDENNNPIMNNTVTSQGVTVTYEDDETTIIANEASLGNVSYIQNILQWSNHAADANNGENPKLVIPMTAFLGLYKDNNKNLAHYNSGTVLTSSPEEFELVVVAEKDFNNYDEAITKDGFTNSYKYNENGSIEYVVSEDASGNIIYTLYDEITYDSLINSQVENATVTEYSIDVALNPIYEVYSKVNTQNITPDFTGYVDITTIDDITDYNGKDLSKYLPDENQKSTYIKFDNWGDVEEVITNIESTEGNENITTIKKVKWTRRWESGRVQVELSEAPTYVKIKKNITTNEVYVSAIVNTLKQYKLNDGENYKVVWNAENESYELQKRDDDYKIINFESEFTKLNAFSSKLYNDVGSSDTVNVINLDADGAIYENGEVNGLNNGVAQSETLDLSRYLEDGKYLVINVDMSGLDRIDLSNTIEWGELDEDFSWNSISTRILWNFYNEDSNTPFKGDIGIYKNNIIGTLLAPSGNIIVGTTINASVIADEASNPGGEIHKSQFASVQKQLRTRVLNEKITPKKGNISIRVNKVDSENNSDKLPGAIFDITVKDGANVIARKTEKTNDLGEITLDGIEIDDTGKTYTVIIEEITAPNGYNPNGKIEFEVVSILKDNKYVLNPIDSHEEDGAIVVVQNELVDVTIPNKKIKGSYVIKLTKRDLDTKNLLNGIIFDITAVDSNNNPVELVHSLNGEKINLTGLETGKTSDDGIIEIKDININAIESYTIIISERLSGNYKKLEPIKINVKIKLENGNYVLDEDAISFKDGDREDVTLDKQNNTILLDIANKKVKGSFDFELIKADRLDSNKRLDGADFEVIITKNSTEIYKVILTTDENGYISIPQTKIENENEIYNFTITEKKAPEGYVSIDEPITFSVKTIKINEEYELEPKADDVFDNGKIIVNERLIQVNVVNDQIAPDYEIDGKYNIAIRKINSETKEGLNGVKLHIVAIDDDENNVIDKDFVTEQINGENGYIQINDISILKVGTHKYQIEEIETVNGYVKFERPITFELEVGLNDEEDAYEIKSVKNIGDYSGKVKIEKNEGTNDLIIILPNNPTKEIGDLSLRKFITSVNEKPLDVSRAPVAKLNSQTGKIEYSQTKKPLEVKIGDYILYTIRIYNEGAIDGTATVIKDYLPQGLEYVTNNVVNNQYKWKMLDKEGKVTDNSKDAVFIATDYLNGSVIPAYSGEGSPTYLEVKVVLKVTADAEEEGRLVNIAFIAEDNIEDRDSTPDNTILPDNFSEYKKQEAENSSVTSIINGLEDDEDFENVKVKKPTILPQTGESNSMLKCGIFVIIGMFLITFAAYFIYKKY